MHFFSVVSTLAVAQLTFALSDVCNSGIYKDLLPLSTYAPAESFCSTHYPQSTITATVTASASDTVVKLKRAVGGLGEKKNRNAPALKTTTEKITVVTNTHYVCPTFAKCSASQSPSKPEKPSSTTKSSTKSPTTSKLSPTKSSTMRTSTTKSTTKSPMTTSKPTTKSPTATSWVSQSNSVSAFSILSICTDIASRHA
jgi:hypothetical protein